MSIAMKMTFLVNFCAFRASEYLHMHLHICTLLNNFTPITRHIVMVNTVSFSTNRQYPGWDENSEEFKAVVDHNNVFLECLLDQVKVELEQSKILF